jgi:hypothetical protein
MDSNQRGRETRDLQFKNMRKQDFDALNEMASPPTQCAISG